MSINIATIIALIITIVIIVIGIAITIYALQYQRAKPKVSRGMVAITMVIFLITVLVS